MLRFKCCPKCKGDVILRIKDKYGWYDQCLQCGYLHDLEVIAKIEQLPDEEQMEMKLSKQRRQEFKRRARERFLQAGPFVFRI